MARTARAVILYDQVERILIENQLMEEVASNEGQPLDWQVNSWCFGMLKKEFCLEAWRAIEESMDADLVLVAVRDPAAWVKLPIDWLERWAEHRRRPAARLWLITFGCAEADTADVAAIGALRLLAESRALPFAVLRRVDRHEDRLVNSLAPASRPAGSAKKTGLATSRRKPARSLPRLAGPTRHLPARRLSSSPSC